MNGKQLACARRLLGWSQEHLSRRLGGHPSASAIRNFERQWKRLRPEDLTAIRVELEHVGVEFDPDGMEVRIYKH